MAIGQLRLLGRSSPHQRVSMAVLRALAAICLLAGACIGTAQDEPLWPEEEQRLRVGLKLFSAVLGAVEGIEARRSPDGDLKVVVVCDGSEEVGREAAMARQRVDTIRNLPLTVRHLSVTALDAYQGPPLGGIFVACVDVGGERLRAWSQRHHTLVFSPFAGDVEAGAVAGIYVSDQILPYINTAQAKRAEVSFKPFFLQVARQYE